MVCASRNLSYPVNMYEKRLFNPKHSPVCVFTVQVDGWQRSEAWVVGKVLRKVTLHTVLFSCIFFPFCWIFLQILAFLHFLAFSSFFWQFSIIVTIFAGFLLFCAFVLKSQAFRCHLHSEKLACIVYNPKVLFIFVLFNFTLKDKIFLVLL